MGHFRNAESRKGPNAFFCDLLPSLKTEEATLSHKE